jgi:ribosomal protein S18 acetylase RimI-like enzyme
MKPVARRAASSDIPTLVELMGEFYAESSFRLDEAWAARAFEAMIGQPAYGAVWVIESAGVPVGHAVLSVRFAMEFGGLSGYIDDLFVRPSHRRQGMASVALDALLAECRRRECRSVHVEVGLDNGAAQALYRAHGLAQGEDRRQALRLVLEPAADSGLNTRRKEI